MRIFGHLVVRNEADRFLESCLKWNRQWMDTMHVYDDRSDDETLNICLRNVDYIGIRQEEETSFIEDESKLRQAAWNDFEKKCNPEPGDWVFCFDADEFLVGTDSHPNPRNALEELASYGESTNNDAFQIRRGEVWDTSGIPLLVRTDGYWGKNSQVRYVKWKPKGVFRDVKLGCGSVPSYGFKRSTANLHLCSLLHFGYSIPNEAQRKYDQYSSVGYGKRGGNRHNSQHIESLLAKPTLTPLMSQVPKFWRGTLND